MPRLAAQARRNLVQQRKEQILTAAARVFARKGFERATIADIAREAGVAEGSIYNYFKNKSDLLISIPHLLMQPAVESIARELDAVDLGRMSPDEVLTLAARSIMGIAVQNSDLLRVLVSTVPTMNRAIRAKYLEQVPLYAINVLEGYFRKQIEAGVFRSDLNPALAARTFPGMFLLLLALHAVFEDSTAYSGEEAIRQVVDQFLRGALADPRPAPARKRAAR